MTILLYIFLLFHPGDGGGLYKTARINNAKELAEKAFKQKNYKNALKYYTILTDSFKVSEETILLNKSHCYFNLNDKVKAKEAYNKISHAENRTINSIANQQLGTLAFEEKNLDLAKNYYKTALKAHPENNEARYNYELVSRLLKKQEENEKKNQDNKEKKEEPPQEPSLFAKKLKEQAEGLAGSYKYSDAYNLMIDGVKKDKSVLYYKEFIDKLKVVADLSKI
jgi:tetratricopeptide (TPR) repeat protein